MASYDERREEADRDQRYYDLMAGRLRLETQVQNWMDEATNLHGASPLPEEQASIVAQRNSLIGNLRTILGV